MYRKLLPSIKGYEGDAISSAVITVFQIFCDTLIPFEMAKLIDRGVDAGDMSNVWKYGLIIFVLSLIGITLGILAGVRSSRASSGFATNLRRDIFYKVQGYSFSNIDKFSAASIVTRLTTDISNIQVAFQMLIVVMVRAPLNFIFAFAMALTVNARLSLIFLAATPVLFGMLVLILRYVHPIMRGAFEKYDDLNKVVQENLRGIRVVKNFVREDYECGKFSESSGGIMKDFVKAEKLIALNMPVMTLCVYTVVLLIAWLGGKNIVYGSMTTGELTSLISYALQLLMSLMMLGMVVVMITISRAAVERTSELLSEESSIANCAEPVTEVTSGSIDFENVSFSYKGEGGNPCLMDIDLHIDPGETVGILGGTGSSKSTLVQLIPRLYETTGGSVKVGGRDVREYDLTALRSSVAMVLQNNVLFSGTIKENLRWGNENATDEQLAAVCRLACADEFIREFPDGYDTYIEQGGTNVSGGQRQRLCIARALLKHPAILILDDSTSAVDTATDARIMKAFREEIPDTTKLIIAQRVASVQDADKIIIMDGGRIDAIGTHEELLASNTIYQEVYTQQTRGGLSDAASD